jgi:hypothetical protein
MNVLTIAKNKSKTNNGSDEAFEHCFPLWLKENKKNKMPGIRKRFHRRDDSNITHF